MSSSPHSELNRLGFTRQIKWPLGDNRTVGKALVRARQPGFGFNHSDVARCQLEPQLQDLLSRHTLHVSSGLNLVCVVLVTVPNVLPNQPAREECAETPLSLVLDRNVWLLEISCFDLELSTDFAQPPD